MDGIYVSIAGMAIFLAYEELLFLMLNYNKNLCHFIQRAAMAEKRKKHFDLVSIDSQY